MTDHGTSAANAPSPPDEDAAASEPRASRPPMVVWTITVLHVAGWKKHYSLYPATDGVIARFANDLEPYDVNDKGTIRFPLDEPVPLKLIERIAKFRATDVKAKLN